MTLESRTFKSGNAFYRVDSKGSWEALMTGFFIDDPYATRPRQKWMPCPKDKVPKSILEEAG